MEHHSKLSMSEVEEGRCIARDPATDIEARRRRSFQHPREAEATASLANTKAEPIGRRGERVMTGGTRDILVPAEDLVEEQHLAQLDLLFGMFREAGIIGPQTPYQRKG